MVNLWSLIIQGWDVVLTGDLGGVAPLRPCGSGPVGPAGGSFLDGDGRVAVWLPSPCWVAKRLLPAALATTRVADRPDPLAERHGLFVIIAGEVLVAVGAALAGLDLTSTVGPPRSHGRCRLRALVGLLAACPGVVGTGWRALPDRGVARDLFTFGHFLIVFGLSFTRWRCHGRASLRRAGRCRPVGPRRRDRALRRRPGWLQWQTVRTFASAPPRCCWSPRLRAGRPLRGRVVLVVLVGLGWPQQAHTYRSFVVQSMAS
ncbi:MAG: hypothetical protein H6518_02265 [Microthrixaceae bacterium]|nr:hypothetical protein [Microthrixaceae bacterium]